MDKFSIINHAMGDNQWYTKLELSKLVGFNVTRHSIKSLLSRGLIREKEEKLKTTQTDLFTSTKAPKTIRSGDFEIEHQGGEKFNVMSST